MKAVIPAWPQDHNTESRRRWINRNDDATRVEWAMLKTVAAAFVLAVVCAVVKLWVAA